MNRKVTVATAAFLMACTGQLAHAYEEDVHYGLTRWLALQAAFTPKEADILADGAVSYDHSALSAPKLVFHYACRRKKDAVASQSVQENHFPGDGRVPGHPKDRAVAPNGKEARRKSTSQIVDPSDNISTSIEKFGQGLHSLQDSWSHQGMPDPPAPPLCDATVSWGHPRDRGGWWRHVADLTYVFPRDTIAMAHATYDQICAYSKQVLKRGCDKPFAAYVRDIDLFAKASTKKAKRDWFVARGFTNTSFISDTSLWPGLPGNPFARRSSEIRSDPEAVDDTEEAQFMLSFLTEWMTRSDLASVVKERIDFEDFRYGVGSPEMVALKPQDIEVLLTLWRSRDHGAASEMLHEMQKLPGIGLGVVGSMQELIAPFEGITDVLQPLDEARRPVIVATLDDKDGPLVVGVARFGHAPHESILIFAKKRKGTYRIVGIAAVIEN